MIYVKSKQELITTFLNLGAVADFEKQVEMNAPWYDFPICVSINEFPDLVVSVKTFAERMLDTFDELLQLRLTQIGANSWIDSNKIVWRPTKGKCFVCGKECVWAVEPTLWINKQNDLGIPLVPPKVCQDHIILEY